MTGMVVPAVASGRAVHALRGLLFASALLPLCLFLLFAVQNREQVMDGAEERARRTVEILEEHAWSVFRMHQEVLDTLDDRIAGMSWDEVSRSEELFRYLKTTVARVPEITSIWLIDKDGKHRLSSFKFPTPPMDVSDRDYFRAERERDAGMVIGKPAVGRATGTLFFSVARRRSSPSGSFDGVVSVSIEPSVFTDFYKGIVPDPNRVIVLMRADGTGLVRDPAVGQPLFAYDPDSRFMHAIAEADAGVFRAKGEMDGVERLYAYQKLQRFPVFIMVGYDRAEILAQWHRNMAVYAIFATPAWLLLMLAAWVALQRAKKEEAANLSLRQEMERREAAEKALLQSQKLEAVGQLTGSIAHDFNNLLTVVTGNLDLVLPRLDGQDGVLRRLGAVQSAAQRGARLTRQLLAFARRQSLEAEVIDLAAGVKDIAELLDRSLRGDIRTDFRLPPNLWPIEVDRAQLEMAILNIAMNARDAMPTGGHLVIEARNVVLGSDAAAEAASAQALETRGLEVRGEFVALTLSDTGAGIPADVLKRVFEPFFTTKKAGLGSGLGLSQVYGFARQSGGDVRIESELDRGTRVTLYLPRARSVPARSRPIQGWVSPDTESVTILVVEDDEAVADLARAVLEGCGHRVHTARSGIEALAYLVSDSPVDLVFSDVVMPGEISGLDLALEIRSQRPHLPVLLTTGYSNRTKEISELGLRLLQKPYAGPDLEAAIQACLEQSRRRRSA